MKPACKILRLTAGEEKSANFSVGVLKIPVAFGVAPFVLHGLEKILLKPELMLFLVIRRRLEQQEHGIYLNPYDGRAYNPFGVYRVVHCRTYQLISSISLLYPLGLYEAKFPF